MAESQAALRQRVGELEQKLGTLQARRRGVRKRSDRTLFGLPLYDIAVGPDPERGQARGHARGIIAVGDVASGVLAVGGAARGGLAVGGAAVGLIAVGGAAIGLLALGGAAIGGVAVGGAAVGYCAVGGGAIGNYAVGGAGLGKHVVAAGRRDPEVAALFKQLLRSLWP
ncbi:MAG TPA: hypothetical protein VHV55_23910 [Pirellulales bacterium]|jgi:hypothetical protein|nr:hypothetical protein [Pirellulales bacterium]